MLQIFFPCRKSSCFTLFANVRSASYATKVSSKTKNSWKTDAQRYAQATVDTAFKQMLSPSLNNDNSVIVSFLNAFVPSLRNDPIRTASEMPPALPSIITRKEKQTFMDIHVVSEGGTRYIIEMQARRHVMFDERALFYACNTYGRQLSNTELEKRNWYLNLKAVLALQIINYDSENVKGMKVEGDVKDTLLERVQSRPMDEKQYIKHYELKDKYSGQTIDHFQMIQVELPRADRLKSLTPPRENFTIEEWWLCILSHSQNFTPETIKDMHAKGTMPEVIFTALNRLDLDKWNPKNVKEYEYELDIKNLPDVAYIKAEGRSEGLAEGLAEGQRKGLAVGRSEAIADVIRNSIEGGMNVEDVAKIVKLSVPEVLAIQKSRECV